MQSRHVDDGRSIYSFARVFLVHCPKCGDCAQVIAVDENQLPPAGKLTCPYCGYAKEGRMSGWSDNEPRDWFFKLPLWLQTPCCGHILWAFNVEHLSFLESYIQADHRLGMGDDAVKELKIRNATLASRLPKWMIVAKHRAEVLKCLQKLRSELAA